MSWPQTCSNVVHIAPETTKQAHWEIFSSLSCFVNSPSTQNSHSTTSTSQTALFYLLSPPSPLTPHFQNQSIPTLFSRNSHTLKEDASLIRFCHPNLTSISFKVDTCTPYWIIVGKHLERHFVSPSRRQKEFTCERKEYNYEASCGRWVVLWESRERGEIAGMHEFVAREYPQCSAGESLGRPMMGMSLLYYYTADAKVERDLWLSLTWLQVHVLCVILFFWI